MTIAAGETILASDIQAIKDDVDALASATSSTVATSEGTTSTAFVDLTTSGPAVTLTTGPVAIVAVTALMTNSSATGRNFMSFTVSGASSSPTAATNISLVHEGTGQLRATFVYVVTGLTAGSNTFTAKYRASSGTATFADRSLLVIPLGA